jgi:uncharacterized protein YndB with AHSA1/START domain
MMAPSVHKDTEALTMTITVELDATVERAWQLWADPRQLERWWGPPTHPMTIVDHELTPGGRIAHFMTDEEGHKHQGWWDVVAAEPPTRLEMKDGDTDEDGVPNDGNAMTAMVVTLTARNGGRTLMALEIHFLSLDGMEQAAAMGMLEGMSIALDRIEAVLAG